MAAASGKPLEVGSAWSHLLLSKYACSEAFEGLNGKLGQLHIEDRSRNGLCQLPGPLKNCASLYTRK
eukprot:scaffold41945_cov19-Tisochrysis_lutea.AAC.1